MDRHDRGSFGLFFEWTNIAPLFSVALLRRAVPLEFVALKFQKSARHYTEAAADEVQLLTKVKDGMRHPFWREAAKSFSVSYRALAGEA